MVNGVILCANLSQASELTDVSFFTVLPVFNCLLFTV